MQNLFKIKLEKLSAFATMQFYIIAIAFGAELYLPFQLYAPGIFHGYQFYGFDFIAILLIAILCTAIIPKKFDQPSDWFLTIFIIFLLAPGLTLGVGSENIDFQKKILVLPALIVCTIILAVAKKIKIGKKNPSQKLQLKKSFILITLLVWTALLLLLMLKFQGVMRFSGLEDMYYQRELTSDVGGVWGYAQLYFTFVFSTLLIACGLSWRQWRYFTLGSAGYLIMYLITAEKSQLMFPLFFLAVDYTVKKNVSPTRFVTITLSFFSIIIFGVILFSETSGFFDVAGFYFFTRLVATPGQFILDYYDFFSKNGYTFFSQIRGFDLVIAAPDVYAHHPKWPQLGWIVGSGMHQIESNSNATFIATDGAASLGAIGMVVIACILCSYLTVANHLSQKFPKIFWTTIFSQQAFTLINGSFFSLLLSFGGLFYLVLFFFYKPIVAPSMEVK